MCLIQIAGLEKSLLYGDVTERVVRPNDVPLGGGVVM